MSATSELLPCPNPFGKDHRLLGDPRLVDYSLAVYEGRYHTYKVSCGCGIDTEAISGNNEQTVKAEAIAAWNTRKGVATLADRINALAEIRACITCECSGWASCKTHRQWFVHTN